MKKIILSTLAISALSLGAIAQNVNIPDANLKALLLGNSSINTNADSEIQVSEAVAFTGQISVTQTSGVTDMTGLEAFTNLSGLQCVGANIGTIDVSQNTALTLLNLRNCNLSAIDITQNSALLHLYVENNNLTSVDVSQNSSLISFLCSNNTISNLDVSQNPNLQYFFCDLNALTSLDVSQNSNLIVLQCESNSLSALNMKNISSSTLTTFDATSNPNLTCIEVDDVADATANWTNIDATASFNLSCCTINIPDVNFKAYLIGNSSINTNGDGEIQCSEAANYNGVINCPNLGIADLTGIEAFPNTSSIYCDFNNLTTLDVSSNTSIINLVCNNNSLTSLDITGCTVMTQLILATNNLTTIDLSTNTALLNINVGVNNLIDLDLSSNPNLTHVYCFDNNLSSLNVANGNNTNIGAFISTTNPNLTCIQVDDPAYSTANWTNIDAIASFSADCNYLGLDEPMKTKFNIYPNPTNSILNIDFGGSIDELTLIDITGKPIMNFEPSDVTIDLSGLATGIYYLQVRSNNETFVKRVLKN